MAKRVLRPPNYPRLALFLKERRRQLGKTMKQMARECDLGEITIEELESGTPKPRQWKTVVQLGDGYEVPATIILYEFNYITWEERCERLKGVDYDAEIEPLLRRCGEIPHREPEAPEPERLPRFSSLTPPSPERALSGSRGGEVRAEPDPGPALAEELEEISAQLELLARRLLRLQSRCRR